MVQIVRGTVRTKNRNFSILFLFKLLPQKYILIDEKYPQNYEINIIKKFDSEIFVSVWNMIYYIYGFSSLNVAHDNK